MRQARDRLEHALDRIADPAGEGSRAFLSVATDAARAAADAADARAKLGLSLGPLDGVIVSIKDLYDVKGERTTAASRIYADVAPAEADCPAVARLRAAGAVLIGRTNLSEFAFHTLGTNPHYGTPGNPHDRARIPGGSSSGAAVSVVDRMADIGLGSDTAGSIRVPAALCGCVGFKPTQKRVPRTGVFALSYALDSVGPLARTVAEAHAADAVLAGEPFHPLRPLDLAGLRVGLPVGSYFLEDLDPQVSAAFDAGLRALTAAGARLVEVDVRPQLAGMTELNAKGGFSAIEANHVHRAWLGDAEKRAMVDPFVMARIGRGTGALAVDYIEMQQMRERLVVQMDHVFDVVDVLVTPSAATVAPRIDSIPDVDTFINTAFRLLRNTFPGNVFDLCSGTVPLPVDGLPVGLMLTGRHGGDARVLQIMAAVEAALRG